MINCPPNIHQVYRSTTPPPPKMLPCLRRVLRPALSLGAGSGFTTSGVINHRAPAVASLPWLLHRCHMGTHPLKESVEPLNSPRGAKEFIYSLHPSERTCLLRELHRFESIAIAQGRSRGRPATRTVYVLDTTGQNQQILLDSLVLWMRGCCGRHFKTDGKYAVLALATCKEEFPYRELIYTPAL